MERKGRGEHSVKRNRLNFAARSVAAVSIAAAGVVAAEKSGSFDPLASSVDSTKTLVLNNPHRAYEQLIDMLPEVEKAEAQSPQSSYRALIVYERACSPGYQNDAYELRNVLVMGGWTRSRIIVEPIADNLDGLKGQMRWAFDPDNNNNTDLKLFYFSGHGGKLTDQEPIDEPTPIPQGNNPDEDIDAKPAEGVETFTFRDDELATTWAGFNGKKVLIFDACYSGGMVDGSSDPKPSDSYIMMACQHDEQAAEVLWETFGIPWKRYGVFTTYLRKGLCGPAETNNPPDGITFQEAFNYADKPEWYEDFDNQDPKEMIVGAGPNNELMVTPPNPNCKVPGVPKPETKLLKCAGDSCPIDGQCDCPVDEFGVGGIAELPDVQAIPQNLDSQESKDKTIPIAASVAAAAGAITAAGAVLYSRRNRSS